MQRVLRHRPLLVLLAYILLLCMLENSVTVIFTVVSSRFKQLKVYYLFFFLILEAFIRSTSCSIASYLARPAKCVR